MNNRSTIVTKFGGTSMRDAESIRQVGDIVQNVPVNPVVVVSATSGTTDRLIDLANNADDQEYWRDSLQQMVERHQRILEELEIELELGEIWSEMESIRLRIVENGVVDLELLDRVQVVGERVSSQILAEHLRSRGRLAESVDSYELVQTDNNYGEGHVDFERTERNVRLRIGSLLGEGMIPVVTGFNGRSEEGRPITLGRGGSDYTAAILGAALQSEEVQIWTDVSGIYNANPRYIEEARPLEQVSFEEAGELAYFGAKVLHPKTIEPARLNDIPVRVLNTFEPQASGTVIENSENSSIKSLTYKQGVRVVNIHSARMLNAHGFLAEIFEKFAKYEVVVDVVSTSEVSISLTVNNPLPVELVRELEEFSTVEEVNSKAIICLVGDGIASNTTVLGRLFGSIMGHEVFMVSQGASQRNITFMIEEADMIDVLRKVFNTFFNTQNYAD